MSQIPAKFKNYDVYNADGTVRYTRHQDGSVLLPTFVYLATGEEVSKAFFDAVGVPQPIHPYPPLDAEVLFGEQNKPQGFHALQVCQEGFIRLGDQVTTKNGRTQLVGLLENYAGVPHLTTRADQTTWPGKVYLPTGQEISDAILAWTISQPLPHPDTYPPTAPHVVDASQVGKSARLKLSWCPSEDSGQGVASYNVYSDSVLVGTVNSPTTEGVFDLGSFGTHDVEVEAVDAAGNVGPRSQVTVTLTALPAPDTGGGTPGGTEDGATYYRTHAGAAPVGAMGPTTPPTSPSADDAVMERWDDVVRVWTTVNGTAWNKPIEFPLAGGSNNRVHLRNVAAEIPVPYTNASGFPSDATSQVNDVLIQRYTDAVAFSVRTGASTWPVTFTVPVNPATIDLNTHAAEVSGAVPVPYTSATNPPADNASNVGDLFVQKFDDALAYSVRTGAGTWPVSFIWKSNPGSSIVTTEVNPYSDHSTWSGTPGVINYVVSNDANGDSEFLGYLDAAGTAHPISSLEFHDVDETGGSGIGVDPEAPTQTEILTYLVGNTLPLPLPGDVFRYTTPNGQLLVFDVGWNGQNIEYHKRTAAENGGSSASLPVLTVTGSGHSLVAGDVGKPLSGATGGLLYDDTDSESQPIGIVTGVPNTQTIEYAPPGTTLDIPRALLEGEATWNLASDAQGRFVDWDLSKGLYVGVPADDSNAFNPQTLFINKLDTSTVNVTVLDGESL